MAKQNQQLDPSRPPVNDLGPAQYPCPVCTAQFHQAQDLDQHLDGKHPELKAMAMSAEAQQARSSRD